jgi:hypothetical protein
MQLLPFSPAPCHPAAGGWAARSILAGITLLLIASVGSPNDFASDTLAVRAILDTAGFDSVPAVGVIDTVNGRVDKLTLRAGISSVAPEIGMLDKMRYLFLEDNQLTSLPASLAQCTSIIRLYLHHNLLDTVPACILALPHLFDLRISNNRLTRLPDGFDRMPALDTLFCDYNLLDSVPVTLCRAKRLKGLNFRFNQLSTVPDSVSNLDSLVVFTLCCNRITRLPLSLTGLSHIRLFDCGGNRLCNVDTAIASWIDAYGTSWRATQTCDTNAAIKPVSEHRVPGNNGVLLHRRNRIRLTITQPGHVNIALYAINGKKMSQIFDGFLAAGKWDFSAAPRSGLVFCMAYVNGVLISETPNLFCSH